MSALLELSEVTKRYGSLVAVDRVSLDVRAGERHALIGPNGAGKSTLFALVAGASRASEGRIAFDGRDITALPEHRRARLGVGRTFQRSSLFDRLAALENVAIAVQRKQGVARKLLRRAARYAEVTDGARELLRRVGLADRESVPAGQLSHGERRQLEIAVALAGDPSLLLMDEPTAGMSDQETGAFRDMLETLAGLTVLIVEHDMDVVFGIADRITVLNGGKLLADGPPMAIRDSPAVQAAYLGRSRAAVQRSA